MHIVLHQQRALVGASSNGLGKAIAIQLAASGATVILLARNEMALKELVEQLPKPNGQKHEYLVADFSNFEQFKVRIDAYFAHHHVDILVNNTSGPHSGSVLEQKDLDYVAAFNLLFRTVQYVTTAALPYMIQQKYGRIINLTSRTVKEPAENLALSNTIRAAVVTWGKTLASSVAKNNITVNSVLTGNFDTDRLQTLFQEGARQKGVDPIEFGRQMALQIPTGRLGRPEEMAQLVTFLASQQASYITGTSIPIDGGLIKSC